LKFVLSHEEEDEEEEEEPNPDANPKHSLTLAGIPAAFLTITDWFE